MTRDVYKRQAQCLADMLKGYGVTHVFHVPAVLRTTYAEMERRTDIKRLHVHLSLIHI